MTLTFNLQEVQFMKLTVIYDYSIQLTQKCSGNSMTATRGRSPWRESYSVFEYFLVSYSPAVRVLAVEVARLSGVMSNIIPETV